MDNAASLASLAVHSLPERSTIVAQSLSVSVLLDANVRSQAASFHVEDGSTHSDNAVIAVEAFDSDCTLSYVPRLVISAQVLFSVLPFALCINGYAVVGRVSRLWLQFVNMASSWTASRVDLRGVVVPRHRTKQLCTLWSSIDCAIVGFPNLFFTTYLAKPIQFHSTWMSTLHDKSSGASHQCWHRNLYQIKCCLCLSQWPVLPAVHMRSSRIDPSECVWPSTSFSVGWSNALCPLQLARVVDSQRMMPSDDSIHVCMLHFPHVCSHNWHPRSLILQHFHGGLGMGFDESRAVDMLSPFQVTDKFELRMNIDFVSDCIHIQVDDGATLRIPASFQQAKSPAFFRSSIPQWRFFMYASRSVPPHVCCEFLDVLASV